MKFLEREDITRDDGKGLIYLRRWTLLRTSSKFWLWRILCIADIRIYLHKFLGDDEACLHSHPNNFFSIMLKGGYNETLWNSKTKKEETQEHWAPKIRFCKSSHTHRITLINGKPAWTIVIMFKKKNQWGFFVKDKKTGRRRFYKWDKYAKIFGGKSPCEK